MKKCPKCRSENIVKNGFVKARQRYKCKSCSYNPSVLRQPEKVSKEIKRFALSMYLEGLGFNSIGKLLGVSHVSVMNWIRNFGEIVEECRSTKPASVVEIDEMHTYIGYKKTGNGFGLLLTGTRGVSWMCYWR